MSKQQTMQRPLAAKDERQAPVRRPGQRPDAVATGGARHDRDAHWQKVLAAMEERS
jgi:hypothetical protein